MDSLSIVIPAYNEEKRLPQTLRQVLDWLALGAFSFREVIVVDDGSRDGTARVVEEFAKASACLRLVKDPGNRGKGYAVRHGMLEAKGEWILYTDADLSTPITEIEKLCRAASEKGAKVAIGSRALDRSLYTTQARGYSRASPGRNLGHRKTPGKRLSGHEPRTRHEAVAIVANPFQ